MNFFDIFKRKNNQRFEDNLGVKDKLIDITPKISYTYSNFISNETLDKIKNVNHLDYVNDILIQRMERYPELVDLLLKGDISEDTLFLLSHDKLFSLPNKEDLEFIKFLDFDEKNQKLVALLKNTTNSELVNSDYISSYIDLSKDFETVEFCNEIASFLPDIKINLGNESLTKTSYYSPLMLYFPKSKYKVVYHNFEQFISGNIELNEDIIVQMNYDTFRYLDETTIDKISKCKIVFSDNDLEHSNEKSVLSEEEFDYKLIKYNHLIYIIENSSLDVGIKDKLIYQLKNMYLDNMTVFDFELADKILSYLTHLNFNEIKKLTKEFEININIYKTKDIEKPVFNASYYIDEIFPDFDSISLQKLISHISFLSEELKIVLLKEPRILKKLNLSDNLDESALKKVSFLLGQRLDGTTIDFINSLDFDVETFMLNKNNNHQSTYDINPIIRNYGIFDYVDEKIEVSIADLIGHDAINNCGGYKGKNILYTFENFFKKNSDSYHTRALGLLEYRTGEELLEELEKRHDTVDMKVNQIENGKYVVSSNGLHRFTVLRFHYLLDCMRNKKSKEELHELYKIPVNLINTTNFKKTYCNYLLQKANPDISSISFDHKKDEITIFYGSAMPCQVINEEKLLLLAVQSADMLDSKSLSEVTFFYKNYLSFREFIDKYIYNLSVRIKTENEEMFQR